MRAGSFLSGLAAASLGILLGCGSDCEEETPLAWAVLCESPVMDASFTGDDLYHVVLCREVNEAYFGQVVAANAPASHVTYVELKQIVLLAESASGQVVATASGEDLLTFGLTISQTGPSFFTGTTHFGETQWTWDGFTASQQTIHFDRVGQIQEGTGGVSYTATRIDGSVDLANSQVAELRLYLYEADGIPTMKGWMRYSALGYVSEILHARIDSTALPQGAAAAVLLHAILGVWADNSGINLGP